MRRKISVKFFARWSDFPGMSGHSLLCGLLGLVVLAILTTTPAQAKPRGCFTSAEMAAERIVRYGLFLREGAKRCNMSPWSAKTLPLWQEIDQQFGSRFAASAASRTKAFQREFPDDAENRLDFWNGRIVYSFRSAPLSEDYCAAVRDRLEEGQKKGWSAISKQAAIAPDEIRMDYRTCP